MKNLKWPFAISWQRLSLLVLCVILALVLFVLIFATVYVNHLLGFITGDDSNIQGTLSSEQMATATDDVDDIAVTHTGTGEVGAVIHIVCCSSHLL